jgi:chromosomal replication initiation ATPase DnaA
MYRSDQIQPSPAQKILWEESKRARICLRTLRSPNRKRKYHIARYRAMRRLRDDLGLSYPQIGRLLHRDHTTIMEALAKGPIYEGMEC